MATEADKETTQMSIDEMWRQLRIQRFPKDTSWRDIPDAHLLLTDTYAAGCIMTYLGNQPRSLDLERVRYLEGCVEMLDLALASGKLQNGSLTYFALLRELSASILANCEAPTPE